MTPLEAYKALPFEQKELVGELEFHLEVIDQYFSTLLALLPDKEVVLNVLLDEYGKSFHAQIEAKAGLKKAGFSEEDILRLRAGYYSSCKEE